MKNLKTRDELLESAYHDDKEPKKGAESMYIDGKYFSIETDDDLNGKDGMERVLHLVGTQPECLNLIRIKKNGKWETEYTTNDVHDAIERFNDIANKYKKK